MNAIHSNSFSLKHLIISAISLLTIGQLLSCGGKEAPAGPPPLEVKVVTVVKKDVPIEMEFTGTTRGSIDAEIRARVEGVITKISFEEGKEVKEGQLLYNIDPAEYEAKVAEAQGKLAQAQTALVKAESDLKRIRPLVQMHALSERDLDAAVAHEGAAKAGVEAATAALESAKLELGYCAITAPTTGVIGLTKAKVGEFVGRAPNPVVLNTVSNLETVHVRIPLTEREYLYFTKLKQKDIDQGVVQKPRDLELFLADGSKYPHIGHVVSVDRQIDSTTGTLQVEAAFPNPNRLLRPGQFAKIKVVGETIVGALMIPTRAIRELQGQFQIFVIKADNTVEQRTVKVGQTVGELRVITDGVAENEVVAIEGIQRLKSGMTVVPQKVE